MDQDMFNTMVRSAQFQAEQDSTNDFYTILESMMEDNDSEI